MTDYEKMWYLYEWCTKNLPTGATVSLSEDRENLSIRIRTKESEAFIFPDFHYEGPKFNTPYDPERPCVAIEERDPVMAKALAMAVNHYVDRFGE